MTVADSLTVAITHQRGAFTLDVCFTVPLPGVVALFGPSGAGKSTILAAIAGLLRPHRLIVDLGGEALHRLPPERRGIGVVFQDGKLFPHLTVAGNLRYGLRRARPGPISFDETVAMLGLENMLPRRPGSLSGGERQRVAIGRALLSQPRLLLMDEPLSALDAARRNEVLPYLSKLRSAFKIPIVYASHALDEITRLADELVLLERGRVLASGKLEAVLSRADLPLAARDDAAGLLLGTVVSHHSERGLTAIGCGEAIFLVPLLGAAMGATVRLRVPAREVILARESPGRISVNNIVPARVDAIAPDTGQHAALVSLSVGNGALLARITSDAAARLGLRAGEAVLVLIKSMSVETLES